METSSLTTALSKSISRRPMKADPAETGDEVGFNDSVTPGCPAEIAHCRPGRSSSAAIVSSMGHSRPAVQPVQVDVVVCRRCSEFAGIDHRFAARPTAVGIARWAALAVGAINKRRVDGVSPDVVADDLPEWLLVEVGGSRSCRRVRISVDDLLGLFPLSPS
jgi:hypothetical protein